MPVVLSMSPEEAEAVVSAVSHKLTYLEDEDLLNMDTDPEVLCLLAVYRRLAEMMAPPSSSQ